MIIKKEKWKNKNRYCGGFEMQLIKNWRRLRIPSPDGWSEWWTKTCCTSAFSTGDHGGKQAEIRNASVWNDWVTYGKSIFCPARTDLLECWKQNMRSNRYRTYPVGACKINGKVQFMNIRKATIADLDAIEIIYNDIHTEEEKFSVRESLTRHR